MRTIFWLALAFLTSFFAFCGQSNRIAFWLHKIFAESTVSLITDLFTLSSIMLSTYLGIIIVKKEYSLKKAYCQNKFLMVNVKNKILSNIESYGLADIGLRLFAPKYSFFSKLCMKFHKNLILPRKILFIKEIEEFTDASRFKNLSFRVKTPYQGIVGECYNSKSTKSVDDLSNELENLDYKFEFNHKQKLSMIKFCLCIPIFNKDNVVGIFQVDSTSNCTLLDDDKKRLAEDLYCFVQSLYDECPNLFIG